MTASIESGRVSTSSPATAASSSSARNSGLPAARSASVATSCGPQRRVLGRGDERGAGLLGGQRLGAERVHVVELGCDGSRVSTLRRVAHSTVGRDVEVLDDDVEHRARRLVHPVDVLEQDQRLVGQGLVEEDRQHFVDALAPELGCERCGLRGVGQVDVERRREQREPRQQLRALLVDDRLAAGPRCPPRAAVSGRPSRSWTSHQNGVYGVVASYGSQAIVNVGISPARRRSSSTRRLLPMPGSPTSSITRAVARAQRLDRVDERSRSRSRGRRAAGSRTSSRPAAARAPTA